MGGTVSGDAPQLDSTRTPCMEAVEGSTVLRAAFSGAMRLNCTLERQPTNPGVLYRSINTGSIWPVSERKQQHFYICEERKAVLSFIILSFSSNITTHHNQTSSYRKKKNIPSEVLVSKHNVITMQINKKTYANILNITHFISMVPVCDHRCRTAYIFPAYSRSCKSKLNAWFLLSVRLFLNLPIRNLD